MVVHDRLIAEDVLALILATARRVYVGKVLGNHAVPQEDIHALLVEHARQGLRVVRLKGGDPYVFGRGGEEVLALQAAGIAFEVVPGVTAASGCSAATGIPLTHRHLAAPAASRQPPAGARVGAQHRLMDNLGSIAVVEHQLGRGQDARKHREFGHEPLAEVAEGRVGFERRADERRE